MALARQRDEWSRASSMMALIANAHRDHKKGRPFRPRDFDPFAAAMTTKVGVGVLKTVFIDRRLPDLDAGGP